METDALIAHSQFTPDAIASLSARVAGSAHGWLTLRWRIEPGDVLSIPSFAGKGRADGLWRTTCFELFVQSEGGEGYSEFNFSPSERWAAYDFDGYRDGMREREMSRDPVCTWRGGSSFSLFDAAVSISAMPDLPARFALTAVLEESDGTKSFWAPAHGGQTPDFHDAACFTGRLAAPQVP